MSTTNGKTSSSNSNNANGGWINNCGQILTSKEGNKLYVKFQKDLVIKAGDTLIMEKNSDNIKKRVEKGFMTEQEGNDLQEKTSFVKYVLHKGPGKDK